MWQAYNSEKFEYENERSLEEERQQILRQQVAEMNELKEERRLKEIYDDHLLDENVWRQQESLRLEYEADEAKKEARKRAASLRHEKNLARLESMIQKQPEREKETKHEKYHTVSGRKEIPRIVIDDADDSKSGSRHVSFGNPSGKSSSHRTKRSEESFEKNDKISGSSHGSHKSYHAPKFHESNVSSTHLNSNHYYGDIHIKEKDRKRFRLPSKQTKISDEKERQQKSNQNLDSAEDTLTSSLDRKIRRRKKPRSKTPAEFSKDVNRREIGVNVTPLPPIGKSPDLDHQFHRQVLKEEIAVQTDNHENADTISISDTEENTYNKEDPEETFQKIKVALTNPPKRDPPSRIQEPATPFDWKIKLEESHHQGLHPNRKSPVDVKTFKKKNIGVLNQLSALKMELKHVDGQAEKNNSENEENVNTGESVDVSEDAVDDGDRLQGNSQEPPEDFTRKHSLGDTKKLDFEATDRTLLRTFLQRFSMKKTQ